MSSLDLRSRSLLAGEFIIQDMIKRLCLKCGYSIEEGDCKWCKRFQKNPNWGNPKVPKPKGGLDSGMNTLKLNP